MRAGLVVDSSALVAILFSEAERSTALDEILDSQQRWVAAFSFLEASIVTVSRKGLAGKALFESLLRDSRLEIVELDSEQAELARDGWYEYGKGRHPAGLTIGDCCSYALAKSKGLPLLYKGDAFGHTDIEGIRLRT